MQDKCPKCGEPLATKTIKKELASGSIDYPISQTCPKCNWSKDLTGAGEIVSKSVTAPPSEIKKEKKPVVVAPAPPKPESAAGINKLITVALAILVLGGLVWAFFLYPGTTKTIENLPQPTVTPEITQTTVQPTSTPVPEVTPTGKKIAIKLDSYRGFIPNKQTVKAGDEMVWRNDGKETVTIVSNDGFFGDQVLAYDKEYRYIFKKLGTYSFNLKGKNFTGTVTVEP